MRIRRTFPIVVAVLAIAVAVTIAVELRKHAPPEAARLLPGADAFFYLDLRMARRANSGNPLPAVSHDPEYEKFIQQTGFQFERDLDEAAFAAHYAVGVAGSNPEPRFSEVFVGKFQSERLTSYLRGIAKSVEDYHSVEIFTIPIENRTLRVAVLSADSIAASNHNDPSVIQGIIDRSQRLASPFGGPSLLRQYYRHVQLGSLAWLVARIEPSLPQFAGWSNFLPHPANLVISASYNPLHLPMHQGGIHLRAEAFAQSAEDALALTDRVGVFLALTGSAEAAVGMHGTDPDVKALFDSFKVKQEGERAVLTATMPLAFLHKMLSGSEPVVNKPAPGPSPQKPAKSR